MQINNTHTHTHYIDDNNNNNKCIKRSVSVFAIISLLLSFFCSLSLAAAELCFLSFPFLFCSYTHLKFVSFYFKYNLEIV